MYIIGVTPDYLEAFHEESRPYRFNLTIYGNLEGAMLGISRVNASEIMGFFVALEVLPDNKKLLSRYLRYCNMISERRELNEPRKRFVFCLGDTTGSQEIIRPKDFPNLEIYLITYSIMTDVVIKRDVFGTLLASSGKYISGSRRSRLEPPKQTRGLLYRPLFGKADQLLLETISIKSTLSDTIIQDSFLQELQRISDFHFHVRLRVIKQAHGSNTVEEDKLISDHLGKLTGSSLIHNQLLIKYVLGGGIVVNAQAN